MSGNITSRSQLRIEGREQILRPRQLRVGQTIARVAIWRGVSTSERLRDAGNAAISGVGGSVRSRARDVWQQRERIGLCPTWRGMIVELHDKGAEVCITGALPDFRPETMDRYMNTDPSTLPDVNPTNIFSNYVEMGLAADRGRWNLAATLDLSVRGPQPTTR